MSLISDVVEGFVKGVYGLFNNKKNLNGWKKLSPLTVPSWVEKASHKFHNKHPVKHHDKRKDFVGKIYIYRVIYRKVAHGRVEETFYRKKK